MGEPNEPGGAGGRGASAEERFVALFVREWCRLAGSRAPAGMFAPLRRGDREEMVRFFRSRVPGGIPLSAIRRIRSTADPRDLARRLHEFVKSVFERTAPGPLAALRAPYRWW